MPNRIVREGILSSPKVNRLGWGEEVFYRRLLSVVDDFGRFHADTGMLRAACYPRLLNKVSDSDVGKWLTACVEAALVRVYPAQDGERYLEVLKFEQQIRAKKSKFPEPLRTCAADATHVQANAHLGVSVGVSVSEVVLDAPPAAAPKPRATRLADDWRLPDDWRVEAKTERPDVDVVLEAKKFADYWHAKAGKDACKLDWRATWRNWVRNARGGAVAMQTAPRPVAGNSPEVVDTPESRAKAAREFQETLARYGAGP